jgi:hypothetical protein
MTITGVAAERLAERSGGNETRRSYARSRVGRLVEIRIEPLTSVDRVESLNCAVFGALRNAGPGAIICADHRRASPLSVEVADAWSRGMRAANDKIARSAVLVDPANSTYNLQLERVVRCALSPTRRLFSDPAELLEWMQDALTDAEERGLRAFLSEC